MWIYENKNKNVRGTTLIYNAVSAHRWPYAINIYRVITNLGC